MRYHRRGVEDSEETPPLHYGHRMRADHILFGGEAKKGSEGETSCLIIQDEFSGCLGSCPMNARVTDSNIVALQRFAGSRGQTGPSAWLKPIVRWSLQKQLNSWDGSVNPA